MYRIRSPHHTLLPYSETLQYISTCVKGIYAIRPSTLWWSTMQYSIADQFKGSCMAKAHIHNGSPIKLWIQNNTNQIVLAQFLQRMKNTTYS